MALTAEQREARKKYLGSSEAPIVAGVSPYGSLADLWLVKTGQAEEFAGNEQTERGDILEPALLEFAERELDVVVSPLHPTGAVHPSGLLITHFDGLIHRDDNLIHRDDGAKVYESVECKTSGLTEGWGEEGTDEVPESVIVQVHHGFACLPSLRVCWVPVLLPGYHSLDFRLYRIERDDELAEKIAQLGIDFMQHHVIPRVPPEDFRPSLEVLRRVKRVPEKIMQLNSDALQITEAWQEAANAMHAYEDAAVARKAQLISMLGDAEGGRLPDGRLVTFMEQPRKGYTVNETKMRVLRIKKG